MRNATGNLYWLGRDLMWIADTLLRQGPVEQIIIGLDQALHHLLQVGLRETPIARDLQAVRPNPIFERTLRIFPRRICKQDWCDYRQSRSNVRNGAGRFQNTPALESGSKLTDSSDTGICK
jgi:hypothetical protein